MSARNPQAKKRPQAFVPPAYPGIEGDKNHHITGPFLPQTPLGSPYPGLSPKSGRAGPPSAGRFEKRSILVRWVVEPSLSFKLLLLPLLLWTAWELLAPYLSSGIGNPCSIFLISGYIPTSSPNDPRYRKTWWDIPFIAYYIVFFSFIREYLAMKVSRPLARYFGLRSEAKLLRFSEQMYALLYFSVFGAWGFRVMSQLPTFWYNTAAFWDAYPYWDIKPELKAYYLIQFAYWWQQLLVLVLGLEKARTDYKELVAHHLVTLWLVGWSYITNFTVIGNPVFMSMDIPDAFFALSKLFNYVQWNVIKTYSFAIFIVVWTYFRHYLNIWILWSVWFESANVPEWTKHWSWSEGVYMPSWMPLQIFLPLLLLQGLNLFWYHLIWKVLIRSIATGDVDDSRSDDEDDGPQDAKDE